MKKNILPLLALLMVFASCSTYRQAQTPDDVYYSPGKTREYASAQNASGSSRYGDDEYIDPSNNEDRYLRMKVQNPAQWSELDDYNYWYSPSYAYNNFYGFNSFNPYAFNSWGLSYYYSPFASIQPFGWFNNYYPSYGFGSGYSPYYGSYFGHSYGVGYYGYTPTSSVFVNTSSAARARTSRPLLGGFTNNTYNNSNNRRVTGIGDRYVPANNNGRYNNDNSQRFNNNTSRFNNTNTNSFTPSRSYTPSSGGGTSGGSVSRPGRH